MGDLAGGGGGPWEDIPMSDVVIRRQPGSRDDVDNSSCCNVGGGGGGDHDDDAGSPGPQLTGLGPLRATTTLIIKQRIRAFDLLCLCICHEVEKKHNICGQAGDTMYSAKESSSCAGRFFVGNTRKLRIDICDQTGKSVIQLSRPFNCAGLCCGVCYPHCTQELNVSCNGTTIGVIRERATWIHPVFHIFDGVGTTPLMKVRGPNGCLGYCQDDEFVVTSTTTTTSAASTTAADDDGDERGRRTLATLTKKWKGTSETAVESDSLVVEFRRDRAAMLSVETKALILATAFLINLLYYEDS